MSTFSMACPSSNSMLLPLLCSSFECCCCKSERWRWEAKKTMCPVVAGPRWFSLPNSNLSFLFYYAALAPHEAPVSVSEETRKVWCLMPETAQTYWFFLECSPVASKTRLKELESLGKSHWHGWSQSRHRGWIQMVVVRSQSSHKTRFWCRVKKNIHW